MTTHEMDRGCQGTPFEWLTPRRFALILGVLIFATFPQVLLGMHSFAYRDYGLFGYPIAHYFRDSFWRGEIPLWNPYNEFGTPFLAQWGTMVLYPGSLIYLLLPLPWSLSLFCLLHLFFGGMGMYVLASTWSNNRLAGGVAGVGFAFSGLVLNCLIWPNYTASLAWMPWVTYAVSLAWAQGGRKMVWASLAGAMQMLSGTPEVILLTWMIIAGLWLCTSIKTWANAWVSGRRTSLIILFVTCLSAAQLLPFGELLSCSDRNSSFEKGVWPIPTWGWANLFVPLFRSHATGCGVHFQYDQFFTSSIYSGVFLILLGVFSLLWCRDRRAWFLICAALFALLVSMGERGPVYSMLRHTFPPIGFMRYTSKFTIAMAFAWPLLGAFGLAALLRIHDHETMLRRFRVLAGGIVLTAVVVTAIVLFARYSPFPAEDWSKTLKNGTSRIGLLVAISLSLFVLFRLQTHHRQWLLQCLIVLLLWMDYMTHMPPQNPTLDAEALTIDLPKDLSPRPQLGQARVALTRRAINVFGHADTSNLTETFLCLRNGLVANANLVGKIPKSGGFYPLSINETAELGTRFYMTEDEPRPGLARFVGISQVISATNLLVWEPRHSYMPMVTAGQLPVFAGRNDILLGLTATNFSPETTVYLPEESRSEVTATNPVNARVLSSKIREHCIEAEVETTGPSMVVVAQTFYRAWHAVVDDQPVTLWRANHAFQALQVPAGHHRVRLVYQDRTFHLGTVISLLALALCAAMYRVVGGRTPPPGHL